MSTAIAAKKKGTVKSVLLVALKHEPPPPWMGLDGELSGEYACTGEDAGACEDDGGDDGFADGDDGEEENGERVDEPVLL